MAKGGSVEDTVGRRCLCNGLAANVGYAQVLGDGSEELPLLTCGEDLEAVRRVLGGEAEYDAARVVEYVLAGVVA